MSQNEYEERKPIIYLAGIGMGQDDQLTGGTRFLKEFDRLNNLKTV